MIVCVTPNRLHLAEASSNKEIDQQLAKPWSEDEVGEAFKDTLAGWKAHSKPSRMKGNTSCCSAQHAPFGFVHEEAPSHQHKVVLAHQLLVTMHLNVTPLASTTRL